ncbi:MAG: histidinol-phosphate transaminase [Paenibacillaceae bacterium]|nr:histidinol-phosphate transaminase [Paenibacillaceae bacterium]
MINPHIAAMTAYEPGFQPPAGQRALKLNANENPYPASPLVMEALRGIADGELRLYPDADCAELRRELAALHGVGERNVLIGSGSDELIALLFGAFLSAGDTVAMPYPTFTRYESVATMHGVRCRYVPTRDDYSVDAEALLASGAKALMLVNPNAPTGLLLPPSAMADIVARFAGLVVVDEAYLDFIGEDGEEAWSVTELLGRHPNLLVLRTFSKSYALCGARVGYGIGDEALIAAMHKCRGSYNVNAVSQRLALAACRDRAHMLRSADAVRRTRIRFAAQLRRLGFDVVGPSQTNFLLCRPPGGRAAAMCAELAARGIYVRHFEAPRLADMLRISIGTDAEMDEVLAALEVLVP